MLQLISLFSSSSSFGFGFQQRWQPNRPKYPGLNTFVLHQAPILYAIHIKNSKRVTIKLVNCVYNVNTRLRVTHHQHLEN